MRRGRRCACRPAAWKKRGKTLACHLLVRRINDTACIVRSLVADAIEGTACQIDWAISEHGNLTAAQAKRMQAELARLPPLPSLHDAMGEERFYAIGAAWQYHDDITTLFVDWNELLRQFNFWFDRYSDAMDQPTCIMRLTALDKIETELGSTFSQSHRLKNESKTALAGTATLSGTIIANMLPGFRCLAAEHGAAVCAVRAFLARAGAGGISRRSRQISRPTG